MVVIRLSAQDASYLNLIPDKEVTLQIENKTCWYVSSDVGFVAVYRKDGIDNFEDLTFHTMISSSVYKFIKQGTVKMEQIENNIQFTNLNSGMQIKTLRSLPLNIPQLEGRVVELGISKYTAKFKQLTDSLYISKGYVFFDTDEIKAYAKLTGVDNDLRLGVNITNLTKLNQLHQPIQMSPEYLFCCNQNFMLATRIMRITSEMDFIEGTENLIGLQKVELRREDINNVLGIVEPGIEYLEISSKGYSVASPNVSYTYEVSVAIKGCVKIPIKLATKILKALSSKVTLEVFEDFLRISDDLITLLLPRVSGEKEEEKVIDTWA